MNNGEESARDPLQVDKLIVDYDYLIYRIKDHMASMHMDTTEICKKQNRLITEGVVEGIIDQNIREVKGLLEKCEELERYFLQLEAIDGIVGTFKERLNSVVKEYLEIEVHNQGGKEANIVTK